MHKSTAIAEARVEAARIGTPLCVVLEGLHASEYEEDRDNSHGFCPVSAKPYIYPHGKAVATVNPDGSVIDLP